MRRNVRFWSRYSAEIMYTILIALAVLEGISFLFGYGFKNFTAFAVEIRMLLMLSAAVILCVLNIGTQTVYLPILLSFGETRKTVFLGYNVTRVLLCIVTVLINAIIAFASGGSLKSLTSLGLTLLLISSLGGITGTLFIRQKWLATLIIIVSCGGIGGMIGFIMSADKIEGLVDKLYNIFVGSVPWWLIVLSLALFLIDLVYHWAVLRRREVRF